MGQSTADTQSEIVQLRHDMSASLDDLKLAAMAPARKAGLALAGVAVVGLAAGGVAVYYAQRRAARARTLRGRVAAAVAQVGDPGPLIRRGRDRARARLIDELGFEVPVERPFHEEIIRAALDSAVKTAIPVIIGVLVHRVTQRRAAPETNRATQLSEASR